MEISEYEIHSLIDALSILRIVMKEHKDWIEQIITLNKFYENEIERIFNRLLCRLTKNEWGGIGAPGISSEVDDEI
jgi:hypothetical protein